MLKKILLAIVVVIILVCIFIVFNTSFNNSFISIKNDTENTISDLKIMIDSNFDIFIEVPVIKQKQTYKTELIFPNNFTEGSIKMIYKDINGTNHEMYIEGYIEKGYKARINVTINSVDNKGVLSADVTIQK